MRQRWRRRHQPRRSWYSPQKGESRGASPAAGSRVTTRRTICICPSTTAVRMRISGRRRRADLRESPGNGGGQAPGASCHCTELSPSVLLPCFDRVTALSSGVACFPLTHLEMCHALSASTSSLFASLAVFSQKLTSRLPVLYFTAKEMSLVCLQRSIFSPFTELVHGANAVDFPVFLSHENRLPL